MERFVTRHRDRIVGILSGFDSRLFRGTLRWLCYADGMGKFLGSQGVLYKGVGAYADRLSAHVAKEDRARLIAQREGIHEDSSACCRVSSPVDRLPSAEIAPGGTSS